MNPKEQERQVVANFNLRIILTIILYLVLIAFGIYRLYQVSQVPILPPTGSVTTVPVINTKDILSLEENLKSTPSAALLLPVTRPEPFD